MSGAQAPGASNLPPGWEYPRLAEIARVNPARNAALNDEEQVNFIPMRAVAPEGGGLVDPEIRLYGEVKKGYTSFQVGDVITAKITPCMENGKTAVVPALPVSSFFGSTEFHVVRAEKGIDPRWLSRFLLQQTIRREAQRAMSGAVGQMRVAGSFIENLRVPLPPSAEQNRAADAIDELSSDLDAGIAALERARAKLEKYRASVLKAAVEGSLTAQWRKEHPDVEPASELLKRIVAERRRRWEEDELRRFEENGLARPKNWKARYKEPVTRDTRNLPPLPDTWCWSSFGECFSVHVGATPSRAAGNYWNGDIPWVASGEVQFCRIFTTREKITAKGLSNSSTQLNPTGSVILNMIGEGRTRGKAGILEIAACNNQNCAAIWVPETPIAPTFIYAWLLFRYEETRQLGSGNNQPAMNKSIVESMTFPLPPVEEQVAILETLEDQLSVVDHLETDLRDKLKSIEALRQSILRDAFCGKLAPQDPNDEPASELLKRIATEREALRDSNGKRNPSRNTKPTKPRQSDATRQTSLRED